MAFARYCRLYCKFNCLPHNIHGAGKIGASEFASHFGVSTRVKSIYLVDGPLSSRDSGGHQIRSLMVQERMIVTCVNGGHGGLRGESVNLLQLKRLTPVAALSQQVLHLVEWHAAHLTNDS